MKKTFLFYDIETTGLNKAFDQVLQFAAIRTDEELNELEQYEIKLKLSPDVVPSPGAVLTHQISPTTMLSGLPEIEGITQIHQLLNQPGTISLGYNTLGFDDEFLRFSFYRNLLPPYTHQYANGCSRADIYPLLILYYLYKNEMLKWYENQNKISLKLEHINQINQLATGRAHDALGDVHATVALAKRLREEKSMWEYALGYFDKKITSERLLQLTSAFSIETQNFREGLLIDGVLGSSRAYQCPALCLGQHLHYKNQMLWLRLDDDRLQKTKIDNVDETTWVFQKKSGDANFILPTNQRFIKHLSSERQQLASENKKYLAGNPTILNAICDYWRHYKYAKIPNLDIDAALYENGFLSSPDESICRQFHQTSLSQKLEIISQMRNHNLRTQAIRIIGRNYPEHMTAEFNLEFAEYLQTIDPQQENSKLVDYRGRSRLTAKAALQEIAILRQERSLNSEEENLLLELENYLQKKFMTLSKVNNE